MKFSKMKMLTMTSAVALAMLTGTNQANAQATATIATTFSTGAALAAASVSAMDFGEWVVNVGGADTFAIALPADITGTPGVVACTGVVDASSVCSQLTAPVTSGVVSVTGPLSAQDVQIRGSVSTPFADANLTLGTLTFDDATGSVAPLPAAFGPTDQVRIVTANTAENIGIGATLSISGTPAASSTFSDAVVTVDFQF